MPPGTTRGRFTGKVKGWLRTHEHEPVVTKIRKNQPVTEDELMALAALFEESGFGTDEDVEAAAEEYGGFGLFLRSLTGLDHEAAAAALAFLSSQALSVPQRGYLQLLVDVLAKNGSLGIADLYEAPFNSRALQGPDELFAGGVIDRIEAVLAAVRANAQPVATAAR
jgi:type I restriction enzyme R subunit